MLGARELDLRANANGRLVRSEGEEDVRREYSHNVVGLESPRNFCKHIDRPSMYPIKYFIKHKNQYTAQKLNKSTPQPEVFSLFLSVLFGGEEPEYTG